MASEMVILALASEGGSSSKGSSMSAQCDVPGMYTATRLSDSFRVTLRACHGSKDPFGNTMLVTEVELF